MTRQQLEGKVCVVTGAASGIGRETALAFCAQGAVVHAIDMDIAGLHAMSQQTSAIVPHHLDVTDAAAIMAFHQGLDRLDVQFNCAGTVPVGTLTECTTETWHRTFAVNVTSIFLMMQAAVQIMLKAERGGVIINMASVISALGAAPHRFAYGTSKAAVLGMTKSVALDYAAQGIRCNAICPSAIETPSMTARIDAMEDPTAARQAFSNRQPVGRMGTPAEIAALAVYLASDASAFMTGSAVVIDGGTKL